MTRWEGHARATVALVAPTCRFVPWSHVAVGALLAGMPVWVAQRPPIVGVAGMVEMLRFSAVPLAVALAFVLDDPSLASTSDTPLSVATRRMVRLAVVVPSVAAVWATLLMVAEAAVADGSLPVAALSLEFGTLAVVTLAAAIVGRRPVGVGRGGSAAAPTTLVLVFVLYALVPDRWAFYAPYPDLQAGPAAVLLWDTAHRRWAVLATVAVMAGVWSSRDPARRDLTVRRRRGPGRGDGPRDPEKLLAASARQSVTPSRPERP